MHEARHRVRWKAATVLLAIVTAACGPAPTQPTAPPGTVSTGEMPAMATAGMDMDGPHTTQQYAPLVRGVYDDGEVLFIHTEASDRDVAAMLTDMMDGPEVVFVPALADAPPALLAQVYVFANGVAGHGPFGFQMDIFDAVPGDAAYRPLRNVNLVEWNAATTPRVIGSVEALESAASAGDLTVTQPGIVVNMPVLAWPGGSR